MKAVAIVLLAWLAALPLTAQPQQHKLTVAGREVPYVFTPADHLAPLALVLGPVGDPVFTAVQRQGWNVVVPETEIAGDWGVKALEAMVGATKQASTVDLARIYLVAAGDLAAMTFYTASRAPDVFSATLAVGGSAKPAIDSNRLFAANAQNSPVIWANAAEPYVARLRIANFPVRTAESLDKGLNELAAQTRQDFPEIVDCETGNAAFSRCGWLEVTKYNPAQRNDALMTTRVVPGAGAYLAFGPFGYNGAASGPGVLVEWLPPDYKGPLKLNDRIVALDGKTIENAAAYMQMMDHIKQEKAVVASVQRGNERMRIDTKLLLPTREENLTARIQGRYLPDSKEILIVSRGVGTVRVQVPPQWAGAMVNWNGVEAGRAEEQGCYALAAGGHIQNCQ